MSETVTENEDSPNKLTQELAFAIKSKDEQLRNLIAQIEILNTKINQLSSTLKNTAGYRVMIGGELQGQSFGDVCKLENPIIVKRNAEAMTLFICGLGL